MHTFGAPRVGNEAFARVFRHRIPSSVRLTHGRDVVPSLPYQVLGFYHTPWEVYLVDVIRADGTLVELAQARS